MRPNLVINGIDFNQRLDDAAKKAKLMVDYKYQLDVWMREPTPWMTDFIINDLGVYLKRNRSDMAIAMGFSLQVQKEEQERNKALERHELFVRYGFATKGFDPITGHTIWD
jgi:hypothetical protein